MSPVIRSSSVSAKDKGIRRNPRALAPDELLVVEVALVVQTGTLAVSEVFEGAVEYSAARGVVVAAQICNGVSVDASVILEHLWLPQEVILWAAFPFKNRREVEAEDCALALVLGPDNEEVTPFVKGFDGPYRDWNIWVGKCLLEKGFALIE